MVKHIVIIGGGAAGLQAGIVASENGNRVTILEHNEKVGKKLFITGKGRCNLTNNRDILDFFDQIPRNSRFLYSALYGFTNEQLCEQMHQWGVPTKVERGERIFPTSDKSSDVISAFSRQLRRNGVAIRLNSEVTHIHYENDAVQSVQLSTGEEIKADRVIVACGGASYPRTGSTDDGYRFARECGHHVTKIMPSLVPIQTAEEWPKQAQGLSLRNVGLTVKEGNRIVYQEQGEMLFTHFGVSGPLVLSCSAHITKPQDALLSIDLKPALSVEKLQKRLQREIESNGKRHYKTLLQELLPTKLIPIFVELSGVEANKQSANLTRAERDTIVDTLKNLDMHIDSFRPIEEAIITRGGVDVKEINPSTMESKRVKGLYFAGEVIDVDAYTGGFNLQIAFSTGYLAGRSAREE